MKQFLFLIFLGFIISCTTNEIDQSITDTEVATKNISGFISITDEQIASGLGLGSDTFITLTKENSSVRALLSKNLTNSPYKLEFTINVSNGNNSPTVYFISDFDRKITKGNIYKVFTTLNLFGTTSYIPGNTGGQIKFPNTQNAFGFTVGSLCTIVIAEEGGFAINDSTQSIKLEGSITLNNTSNIDRIIGNFVINLEGDNLIDLSFF